MFDVYAFNLMLTKLGELWTDPFQALLRECQWVPPPSAEIGRQPAALGVTTAG